MKTNPIEPPLSSSKRNPAVKVEMIVMHSTAGGSLSGDITTLRKRGLAYHYLIDRDGKVYKCIPLSNKCSHAGSSYGPVEQRNGVSREQYKYTSANVKAGRVAKFVAGCTVNGYTVGISFCNRNDGKEEITAKQLASAEELVKAVLEQYPSIDKISCHYEVSPGRKSDPRLFDLDELAQKVGLTPWHFPH